MKVCPSPSTARLATWALAASAPAPGDPVDSYEVARDLDAAGVSFGKSGFWSLEPDRIDPQQAAGLLERGKAVDVRGPDWREWRRCQRNDLPELSRYVLQNPADELATRLQNRRARGATFSAEAGAAGEFQAYQCLLHDKPLWVMGDRNYVRVHDLEELKLLDFLEGEPATLERPEVGLALAEAARVHRELNRDFSVFQGFALVAYRELGQGKTTGTYAGSFWVEGQLLSDPERVKQHFAPFWTLRQSIGSPSLAAEAFRACQLKSERPMEERVQAASLAFQKETDWGLYYSLVGAEGQPQGMEDRLELLERLRRELPRGDMQFSLTEAFQYALRDVPALAPPGREGEWREHYLLLVAQTRNPASALRKLRKMKHNVTRERLDGLAWKSTRWDAPELIRPTRKRSRCGTRQQRQAAALRIYALRGRAGETVRVFKQLFPPERARDPVPTADSFCRLSHRLDQLGIEPWEAREEALTFLNARSQDDLQAGLDRLFDLLGRQSLRADTANALAGAMRAWEDGPSKTGLEERQGRLIVGGVSVSMRDG